MTGSAGRQGSWAGSTHPVRPGSVPAKGLGGDSFLDKATRSPCSCGVERGRSEAPGLSACVAGSAGRALSLRPLPAPWAPVSSHFRYTRKFGDCLCVSRSWAHARLSRGISSHFAQNWRRSPGLGSCWPSCPAARRHHHGHFRMVPDHRRGNRRGHRRGPQAGTTGRDTGRDHRRGPQAGTTGGTTGGDQRCHPHRDSSNAEGSDTWGE